MYNEEIMTLSNYRLEQAKDNLEEAIVLFENNNYIHSLRRVIKMMHTLCKYADETELVISDIITRDNGDEIIRVVFERPTEHGFDTLIFELPSYKIVEKDGQYTDEEIELFKKVVEQGAAHFFEIAREGGLESA